MDMKADKILHDESESIMKLLPDGSRYEEIELSMRKKEIHVIRTTITQ